jgi:hypothetical protein
LSIFAFFNTYWHTFFCHKYTLESQNISWKNEFSFWLNSLCYDLPYYAKNLEKYAPKLAWLKFEHGHPSKLIQCDNICGPLVLCFHPVLLLHQICNHVQGHLPIYVLIEIQLLWCFHWIMIFIGIYPWNITVLVYFLLSYYLL